MGVVSAWEKATKTAFDELWDELYPAENSLCIRDAIDMLDDVGARNPRERVQWMNRFKFSKDDIRALAEIDFVVTECRGCGAVSRMGDPEDWERFQLTDEGKGVSPIYGEIQEERFNAALCDDCLGKIRSMVGL